MKYFKDESGSVWAFESDGSQDSFIPDGLVSITESEANELRFPAQSFDQMTADVEAKRAAAYREESDPLFFDWQRGKATKEQWDAKVQEIKERFPKPIEEIKRVK